MKKFLSMITALSCMTTLISVLPAFAEDKIYSYVVIAVNNPEYQETYLLTDTKDGTDYKVPASLIAELDNQQHFTVGDVLEFHNAYLYDPVLETSWLSSASTLSYGGYETTEEEIEEENSENFVPYSLSTELAVSSQENSFILKTGSITETPEIKDFTFQSEQLEDTDPLSENLYYTSYYLTDGTEKYTAPLAFRYEREYFCQPDAYEYDFLQAGDTVSCYTYQGNPYIMINDSQKDTFQNYLLVSKDNSDFIPLNEAGELFYTDAEKLTSYFLNDTELKANMTLRFRNLSPELETLKDTPHAPAIALHSVNYVYRSSYLKFDVTASDETSVTLSRNEKTYTFPIDFITEAYNPENQNASLVKEEMLTQKTAFCQVWNGIPFKAVQGESLDRIDETHLYVVSVDNSENPQQYFISKGDAMKSPTLFTREELPGFSP